MVMEEQPTGTKGPTCATCGAPAARGVRVCEYCGDAIELVGPIFEDSDEGMQLSVSEPSLVDKIKHGVGPYLIFGVISFVAWNIVPAVINYSLGNFSKVKYSFGIWDLIGVLVLGFALVCTWQKIRELWEDSGDEDKG